MGLDADFNKFRDTNFMSFLGKLMSGDKEASYMSGVSEDFKNNSGKIVEINKFFRGRGGLVGQLSYWSEFVAPPEATRFLLAVNDYEEAADLLDAVVEQERPANSQELIKVFKEPLPNSMRAIMMSVGGEARVAAPEAAPKGILKPVNKSGLNLDAMRDFR